MAITKEQVESKIQTIASQSIHADVLEGKEAYELYNAIVGTTFDKEGYGKVISEAPSYLYDHIPGGSKLAIDNTVEETTEEPVVDPTDNPVVDPTDNPVVDPTDNSVVDPTDNPEPTTDPEPKSEVDPEVDPTTDPVENPTNPEVEP